MQKKSLFLWEILTEINRLKEILTGSPVFDKVSLNLSLPVNCSEPYLQH